MRRWMILAALCCVCAGGDAGGGAPPDAAVHIDNFAFGPRELTVPVGTLVVWTNRDDIPHSVVSADGRFRSGALDTDERFAWRFGQAGRFRYFCSLHAHMQGIVTVR